MKKQSYYQYIKSRIEFALAVGLFMEFDYETKLLSDFDITDGWDNIKIQILKIKPTAKEFPNYKQYDLCFECMEFAKEFRTSPINIANKLKPYIEEYSFIDRVEVKGGYMNIFLDRINFLMMAV